MTPSDRLGPVQPSLPFSAVAGITLPEPERHSGRDTAPFSIRLTADERQLLEQAAAGAPLGTYIRSRILDGQTARRKVQRAPVADQAALARVLAQLGQSRLGNNLNQLAKAANMGALIVTPDVTAEFKEACAAVAAMRHDLMRALGLKEPAP